MLLNFSSFAIDLPQEAEKGEAIFLQKCSSCHTVGGGRLVGPDLKGVTDRRDEKWLRSFIKNPEDLFSRKDKTAMELLQEYAIKMPASGLTSREIDQVIMYFKSSVLKEKAAPQETGEPMQGNKDKGLAFFKGMERFKNGGPPCVSCHTIAGIEIPGGALGPDLTKAGGSYGKDGLSSVLKDVPFPTMQPIYVNKPLTDEEIADLAEFISNVNAEATSVSFKNSAFLLATGLVVFVAIMQFVWAGRLRDVRKTLVNSTKRKEEQ
jgi:mono/diheme cytochrome c family protein